MLKKQTIGAIFITLGLALPCIALATPIPDTGQSGDYTATFGEDSDYTINPQSYTKLDQDENNLPDEATG